MMKRTQIYFPEWLHDDLKINAAMTDMTMAEYIRMILEERIYKKPVYKKIVKKKRKKTGLSLLAENAISFGKKDLARNFDKYFEESLR